jgi:hypothetical protein
VINRTMAERYWPGENPIGQRVHMIPQQATFEIVGVVGDVKPFRPDEPTKPEIYWPFAQLPRWAVMFVVRAAGSVSGVAAGVRSRLAQVDPEVPFDCLPGTARPAEVGAALSNSFGFGGQNVSLVFERVRS